MVIRISHDRIVSYFVCDGECVFVVEYGLIFHRMKIWEIIYQTQINHARDRKYVYESVTKNIKLNLHTHCE